MSAAADQLHSYGGFRLGGLQLALPMSVLREVVPCSALADLPCAAACVIGGIAVRGVVVPVVDLRIALGRTLPGAEGGNVVFMVHGGKILGLLADDVTGIFQVAPAAFDVADAPRAQIFSRGVTRPDNHQIVSLLSPAALSCLAHVPMVDDPEPERQQVSAQEQAAVVVDDNVPMVLLRCGNVALAVEALLVHATVSNPDIEASVLTGGHCRGVIDYAAAKIPAIDLQGLCGLGRLDTEHGSEALIVSLPAGQVALLVGAVVDVISTRPGDVKPVPAFALPRPRLFAGALPLSVLPADVVERSGAGVGHFLVLANGGLSSCDELVALSSMNTAGAPAVSQQRRTGQPVVTTGDTAGRRSMITYMLDCEWASPLEQVREILAYQPDLGAGPSDGALLGFIFDRGRSIPVACLGRATGAVGSALAAPSSVLIVESRGELVGFAVGALGTIDDAEAEPALPDFKARTGGDHRKGTPRSQALALVGSDHQRMLPVLDLHGLAQSLQDDALAA